MISSASSDLAQEVFVADTGVEVAFVPEAMEISSIVAVLFSHRTQSRSQKLRIISIIELCSGCTHVFSLCIHKKLLHPVGSNDFCIII